MRENILDCHCEDPRHEGKMLDLCGSDLCVALTSKFFRNGFQYMKPYILSETEDNEEN